MGDGIRAPTPEIAQALARHGIRPVRIALVSPMRERKGRRLAYRVDAPDGTIVKLRQFESDDAARRVFDLRSGLADAFAPAIGVCGPVLLEEWIEGTPIDPVEGEARAGEAGELLGRLHARPVDARLPATIATARWRAGAESDLEVLLAAGRLGPAEGSRLCEELRAGDPAAERATLTHLDFCRENFLLDRRGRLRVIDNEQISIEPLGLDLGRTYERWPMSVSAWGEFLRGYRSVAPREPQAIGFWRVVAALVAARVLLQLDPGRLAPTLALLRRFGAGDGLSDPA